MLFNNPVFFIFLIAVTSALLFGSQKVKKITLLIASYAFYGYWNWKFTFLLLWSTLIDYFCGLAIDNAGKTAKTTKRKWLLILSIFNNLLILGFFKYFNFFSGSFASLLNSLGIDASFTTLNIVLPVGISFYTFQTMSYTIDIYRNTLKPTKNFIDFANFVSFFPQLVAGPIERASRLLPQVERFNGFVKSGLRGGLTLMLMGYIKKAVISDNIAPLIDDCFANFASRDSIYLVTGLILFSFQVYFDFSGYSDIARGVARLFGIDLAINFNQPYFSINPVEFWRRWHISLSTWLRDYLFLPVVYPVMRKIRKATLFGIKAEGWGYGVGMMVTMFLGGLWHGASWNFVLWGSLHGFYLIAYRVFKGRKKKKAGTVLKVLVMYLLVTLTWLPFRAPNIDTARQYLQGMIFWTGGIDIAQVGLVLFLFLLLLAIDLPAYITDDHLYLLKLPRWLLNAVLFAGFLGILIVMLFHLNTVRPFIYFQF